MSYFIKILIFISLISSVSLYGQKKERFSIWEHNTLPKKTYSTDTIKHYSLIASNEEYIELTDAISLDTGYTWDDPHFAIPLGFTFNFLGYKTDTLFIDFWGTSIAFNEKIEGIMPLFLGVDLDLVDRAYNIELGEETPGGLSDISYKIIGEEGERICIIEWKNAGFWDELDYFGYSSDYINLQYWFYEGTNNVKIHIGPHKISYPQLAIYYGSPGPIVGYLSEYDWDFQEIMNGLLLDGDPDQPEVIIEDYATVCCYPYLNSMPVEGTVYLFDTTAVSTAIIDKEYKVNIYPNPANDILTIDTPFEQQKFQLYSITGSIVYKAELKIGENRIQLPSLKDGMYIYRISGDQVITGKLLIDGN